MGAGICCAGKPDGVPPELVGQRKLIVVFGATGSHGQGLVRAILDDRFGGFAVRGATRDPSSNKAKALAELGAEMVQCDAFKFDEVASALKGAYGAFFVTWSFEPAPEPEKEMRQIEMYAKASKAAGLEHAIFSTTEDTRQYVPDDDARYPTLDCNMKVPHFEAKAQSERFFVENNVPTTFLLPGFYYDNLLTLFPPTKGEDGRYAFTIPICDAKIAWVAADDIGRCAYGIFKAGAEKYAWQHLPCAGEHMTLSELCAAFASVYGMKAEEFNNNNFVTPDMFRTFGFPGCEALGNMFQFEMDYSDVYCSNRGVAKSREYNPTLMGFKAWLEKNKDNVPFVGNKGELDAGRDAEEQKGEKVKNIEHIGFSITLEPEAARLRSAMIQAQVDVWNKAFSATDADGDGSISLEEAKAAGISDDDFRKICTPGTDTATKKAFMLFTQSLAPGLAKARAMFFVIGADANNDGVVSPEEAAAAGIGASQFNRIDVNGDCQVTAEELAEYLKADPQLGA